MQFRIRITFVLLTAVLLACGKDAIRRTKRYRSGDVEVVFRDFTDSRCPLNAECMWEGKATVMLTITDGNESIDFTLDGIGADTLLLGHRIEFTDLLPYPVAGEAIDPEEKELKLNITKL